MGLLAQSSQSAHRFRFCKVLVLFVQFMTEFGDCYSGICGTISEQFRKDQGKISVLAATCLSILVMFAMT